MIEINNNTLVTTAYIEVGDLVYLDSTEAISNKDFAIVGITYNLEGSGKKYTLSWFDGDTYAYCSLDELFKQWEHLLKFEGSISISNKD